MLRGLIKWIRSAARRHRESNLIPSSVRALGRGATRALHERYHLQMMRRAVSGRVGGLEDVEAYLRERAVPLHAPLVLISQAQRSGGTLLSQLFDGHPALAAYPHELRLGFEDSDTWPELDPAVCKKENFQRLFDLKFARFVARGFAKGDHDTEAHRFFLIPRLQRAIFNALWEKRPPRSQREVLDHFFTAFFNAWLDYQGDLAAKRWITAFAPRLALDATNVERFFECYPDGLLLQLVRDPHNWYPSAKNHREAVLAGRSNEAILEMWISSAKSILRNKQRFGERVIVLRFEDLVGATEDVMRSLSRTIRIDYDPALLIPTFNRQITRANSSFAVKDSGVLAAPLSRKESLTAFEREIIRSRCLEIYEKLLEFAWQVGARSEAKTSNNKLALPGAARR